MTVEHHAIKLLLVTVVLGGLLSMGQCTAYEKAKKEIAARDACTGALVNNLPPPGDKATCHPVLKTLVARARAAQVCDDAIADGPDMISPFCTAVVQQLVVERKAALDDLARLQADQAAAITRAETRARNSEKRKSQNARVLEAQPRDSDGLIVCDALCLRQRADPG